MAYVKMIPYIASPSPGGLTGTYTVNLNLNDSDPTTWATYADDAVGMEAGSADWDSFFGHYPCILDNGVELGKLKRTDFTKYEDGTSAPITTLGKDVMICFPRRGIKIEYTDSSHLSVSMTDEEGKSEYSYMGHSYKGNACDKFYLGAYKGYVSSSGLYSSSGKTPSTSITIGNFRTYAQSRGTGYEQGAFYQRTFRQVMYLLKYKGRNSRITIGNGYIGNAAHATGGTNANGMDYGNPSGTSNQVKLFGIEDAWGNLHEFVDGIGAINKHIYVADGNFNDNLTDYTYAFKFSYTSIPWGFLIYPVGTNIGGFFQKSQTYGSETTYFCDKSGLAISSDQIFCYAGGAYNSSSPSGLGVFTQFLDGSVNATYGTVGSRLMYMHVA